MRCQNLLNMNRRIKIFELKKISSNQSKNMNKTRYVFSNCIASCKHFNTEFFKFRTGKKSIER
jgi:hypothetical protein